MQHNGNAWLPVCRIWLQRSGMHWWMVYTLHSVNITVDTSNFQRSTIPVQHYSSVYICQPCMQYMIVTVWHACGQILYTCAHQYYIYTSNARLTNMPVCMHDMTACWLGGSICTRMNSVYYANHVLLFILCRYMSYSGIIMNYMDWPLVPAESSICNGSGGRFGRLFVTV